MSLHRKTVLSVILSIAVLVIAVFIASQLIILGGFERLEQDSITGDVGRASRALASGVARLDSTAKDWAAWEDTFQFVAGNNATYPEENLSEDVLLNLQFSFVYYLNARGDVVYSRAVDLSTGRLAQPPVSLDAWIGPGSLLTSFQDINGHVQGLLMLPEGPALISSRPILRNYGVGPIGGAFVAGRWLDAAETARLADQTQLSLRFEPVETALPADFKAIQPGLSQGKVSTQVLDGQRIAGYELLNDVFGSPAVILRVDMFRSVYDQGRSVLGYMIIALLVGMGVFGAQMIFQLQRQVLSRVSQLGREVSAIGQGGSLNAHVSVAQRDELGVLAQDINTMLLSLHRTQGTLRETEDRLKLVLSSMPVILFVLDRSGRISLVAGAGLDMLSVTPDAVAGRPLTALFGDSEAAFEDLNRVLDGNAVRDTVKAGELMFDVWLLPQRNADGDMSGAIGMAVDVTAREHSEMSLEQVQADLRAQTTRLDRAYQYFLRVLGTLQDTIRQGGAGGDLLAFVGEAEVRVLAHRSGNGHHAEGKAKCPNVDKCPVFRLLQIQAREVFRDMYCEANYERCARNVSASRGERPPDNLMPHGVTL